MYLSLTVIQKVRLSKIYENLKLKMYSFFMIKDYLCDLSDNVYDIEFVRFKIRDIDSDLTLFEVAKPKEAENRERSRRRTTEESNAARFVRYDFASDFLRLKTVGTT